MKRKIFSTLLALVLLTTLSLIPAVVMGQGANYPQFLDVVPFSVITGEWSKTVEDTTPQSGTHSYHVVLPADSSAAGLDIIQKYIYGPTGVGTMTLADITDMTFWEYVSVPGGTMQMGAGITLYLDMDTVNPEDGEFSWANDAQIVLESPYPDDPLVLDNIGKWALRDITDFAGFQKGDGAIDAPYTGVGGAAVHSTLAEWQASDYADYTVLWVGIVAGWGDYGDYDGYFDDFVINGETYDLQPPIFLDASYYPLGDVTVTVIDPAANSVDTVQESVLVTADSSSPVNDALLGLLETGVDTGVFTETFTLVGTTPGAGELLVTQGSTITVTYTGLASDVTDTAEVDSAAPVVEVTAPTDASFVAGSAVSVTWTITETNPDTLSVTIGGEEVATTGTSYTWDTTAEAGDPLVALWPDGAYTIEVVSTDDAANSGSDSIDVTVDNTPPAITLQVATPAVVDPTIENTIVFTATVTEVNVDTVTIDLSDAAIGGSATEPMLDDGLLSDATADDGIYTADITVTIAVQATYTLAVTATDLAGTVATANISLVVSSDIVDPVIASPAITYEYGSSAEPSDTVTISATVTDAVGMGTVTATCAELTDSPIDLLDDGEGDDATADDDVYTGTTTVVSDAVQDDYTITITALDDKGNEATDETLELAVRIGATGYELALVAGWNLISLPLIPDDADITVVISATTLASEDVSSVGTVRGYDPATGDFPLYIPGTGGVLTEMEAGVGYWVFMEEADTLTITGRQMPAPPAVPPTYDVVEGWNLIGFKSLADDIDTSYLANIEGTYPVLWSYDATALAYSNVKDVTDGMVVGHGFWIWITEAGTIVPPQ